MSKWSAGGHAYARTRTHADRQTRHKAGKRNAPDEDCPDPGKRGTASFEHGEGRGAAQGHDGVEQAEEA